MGKAKQCIYQSRNLRPEFTQVGEQLSTELVGPGGSEEQMNSSSGDVLIQD